MSRNVRQTFPRTPTKVAKRRGSDSSSSLDLSDDGGYSGLEDISDSEEDDEDGVDAVEEEVIITDELYKNSTSGSPRPHGYDSSDADEEDSDEDDDDDDVSLQLEDDDADVSDAWEGIVSETEDEAGAGLNIPGQVKRQVRFAGVPDSDSDSTTSEISDHDVSALFPDIFVAQTYMDRRCRREVEEGDELSSNDSYWDFHDTYLSMVGSGVDGPASMGPWANAELEGIRDAMQPNQDTAASSPSKSSTADDQDLDGYECECPGRAECLAQTLTPC